MKEFLEKYGMNLRMIRAYILSTYKGKQKEEIFKEIQAFFDVNNTNHKFNSEKRL
jgi:hypothetical protein